VEEAEDKRKEVGVRRWKAENGRKKSGDRSQNSGEKAQGQNHKAARERIP
jgi:hypothetical protein